MSGNAWNDSDSIKTQEHQFHRRPVVFISAKQSYAKAYINFIIVV